MQRKKHVCKISPSDQCTRVTSERSTAFIMEAFFPQSGWSGQATRAYTTHTPWRMVISWLCIFWGTYECGKKKKDIVWQPKTSVLPQCFQKKSKRKCRKLTPPFQRPRNTVCRPFDGVRNRGVIPELGHSGVKRNTSAAQPGEENFLLCVVAWQLGVVIT